MYKYYIGSLDGKTNFLHRVGKQAVSERQTGWGEELEIKSAKIDSKFFIQGRFEQNNHPGNKIPPNT